MNIFRYTPSRRTFIGALLGGVGIALIIYATLSAQGQSSSPGVASVQQQDQNSYRIFLQEIALLVIGSLLSATGATFWWQRNQAVARAKAYAESHVILENRVRETELKLAQVDQAIIPISTAFQAILIKELTHFHTPEMDLLMTKIGPPNTLTREEDERLFNVLLPQREKDMGPLMSDSERDAAHILPAVVRRAKQENQTFLSLVTVGAIIGLTGNVKAKSKEESK